jgi:uncharacterized protein involved in exopolysaccharide biosynthesis
MTASRQSTAPIITPAPEVAPAFPFEPGSNGAATDRAYLATRLLWTERNFLAKVVLRCVALALLVAFLIPSDYESTTQLMPPDGQSSSLGMLAALGSKVGVGGGALNMGADLLGLKSSGALFVSLLSSDSVRDVLIDRFDLRRVYWTSTYRSARKALSKRTEIQEDKKSGVISITVADHDPKRAAAMGQAYVQELNQLVTSLNTSSAHRERVFLEDRLKVIKKDLDEAARAFSDFSSKNTAIDIKEQGKAMVEAAATLQGEAIAAESELRGLEQIYAPDNYRVRSVQARLSELKRQLNKLGGTSSGDPALDQDGSPAMYPSIRQLPVLGVTYADLYRRVKIDETIYEVLTQEYELARVEEAKQVPSVKVIDPAKPAERRSGPSRMLIVTAGALMSFCAAAMWVFGKEAWNGSPQNPRKILAEEMAKTIAQQFRWQSARDLTLKVVPWTGRNRANGNGNQP